MALYRIMLVDDEQEVRESIIRKIDWESAGFEMVGDAENGEDALEKVEILQPDIVLTDIRMPYMDGLALAQRIYTLYPFIKIIVFSGYDEFEYAKEAIRYNVIEYILKPVNVQELTAILGRIKQSLDNELKQRRNVDALRDSFQKNLPILREHFLNDLVHDRVNPQRIASLLREYRIDFCEADAWVVAHVTIDLPEDPPADGELSLKRDKELIPLWVRQLVEEKVGRYTAFASFLSNSNLCVVAAVQPQGGLDGVIAIFDDVCRECRRALELSVTVGISQVCDGLAGISKSYRESWEAVGYRAVLRDAGVIYIGDVEQNRGPLLPLDKQTENGLVTAVKFGSQEDILSTVRGIAAEMEQKRLHFSQYQFYIVGLLNALLQLVNSHEIDSAAIFGERGDCFSALSAADTPDKLLRWLSEVCVRIGANLHAGREGSTQHIVVQAKDYLAANYQNTELSLERLCRQLHISATYFSAIFKRETGKSYVAYLTELRLDKAVELLRNTDKKTYTVAEEVGYIDPNYFSYVFKKRYGVSPTKFRGLKAGQADEKT